MKKCICCEKEKLHKEFRSRGWKNGKQRQDSHCRVCRNEKERLDRINNPEKHKKIYAKKYWANPQKYRLKARKIQVKRDYGITYEQYMIMLKKQNDMCSICGEKEIVVTERVLNKLSIDHDHTTGQIRGLLCGNCNRAIGMFQENIDILASAISYLQNANIKERRTA